MYKRICIATDGSPHASVTAELGIAIATALDGQVVGVTIDEAQQRIARRARLRANLPEDLQDRAPVEMDAQPSGDRLAALAARVSEANLPFEGIYLEGRTCETLGTYLQEADSDLLVCGFRGAPSAKMEGLSANCERLLRRTRIDTLIVQDTAPRESDSGSILVCIDGSSQSYAGLKTALAFAKAFDRPIEAVGVYDPYLHYTLFNGIVKVLSVKAARVFKFADQEKLHEEIIDTGLAKIYQAHLEVAATVAEDHGVALKTILLDGKAPRQIRRYIEKSQPWLVVLGRIGVHSDQEMDMGETTEQALRGAPCHILITSQTYVPPIDVKARAAIDWTPDARAKMERVPGFVRGVATTAILRWAMERGHSVITSKVINSAMGDLLPPGAAQAMGYVAEELAIERDALTEGKTFLCPNCGYAARDYRPVACPVCQARGTVFQVIDRAVIESLGSLDKGDLLVEKTFDGKRLKWTPDAKNALARVPRGFERRTCKARIEKTARVRGLQTITHDFAVGIIQQDLADRSYLSDRGERLKVEGIAKIVEPDDTTPIPRSESPLPWTDRAWARICRVPRGFMRNMTRERVEQFAARQGHSGINLAACEEGIAVGRRMMAEMLGSYQSAPETVRSSVQKEPVVEAAPAPVPPAPDWTAGGEVVAQKAVQRVTTAGKFTTERADHLTRGVAEERAREKKLGQINASFMARLGKQLGYGHPLASVTAEHQFEWTPEAEATLEDVPAFCREMTRWRVEWTAVKKNLGYVITPEIMAIKYEMWGEVSEDILDREGNKIEWDPSTRSRLERIPKFVQGQVVQSVEGNARKWGYARVDDEVLDRVIDKWITTGDFHEAQYGYK